MLDPKLLRQDIQNVADRLQKRGYRLDVMTLMDLEQQRKALQTQTQALQNARNNQSKAIGQAKVAGQDVQGLMSEVNLLSEQLTETAAEFEKVQARLHELYSQMPNIPDDTVPAGLSETENVQIRQWGEPREFDFPIKDHVLLGAPGSAMDFASASKLSGARFVVLRDDFAHLHRALIQFMLDVHVKENGYREVYVPYIVNAECFFGVGQLPKMTEDLYALSGDDGVQQYLVSTAEVPVTNLHRGDIMDAASLPLQFVCHTPCFRREAGSYGKDTRGMLRQHQFEKVEMVWVTTPDYSYEALELMVGHAESILQKLGLPYRVMALCAGDMGFAAAKTYDLEVWLPGQNKYREISSCSNTESFQARRMQTRWRNPETQQIELVHTLNGSGLAIGRTLLAILENYQDVHGNIHLPEVLWPYMQGKKMIEMCHE